MDWFPLYNSLRIAFIATCFTFFLGICAAYYIAKLPKSFKGVLDVILTIPLVLPPTVVGFFLLKLIGPKGWLGRWLLFIGSGKITMTWKASVFAVVIVTFPLMYRTVRGAFEAFDPNILDAGRMLGRSDCWIFWRVLLPGCRQGLIAGTVLSFARGLGEYGATSMVSGYTPGRTATISTTVYQLWRENNNTLAYKWVMVNITLSFAMLLVVNLLEKRAHREKGKTLWR